MPSPRTQTPEGHDASTRFGHAIVRCPGRSLIRALSTADLGAPDVEHAQRQHSAYVRALETLGVRVTVLPPDDAYPDSVFIEDAALLAGDLAVLTRPGAPSRRGEPATLEAPLRERFAELVRIEAPGTLDAGDVLRVRDRFFVGRSARTNAEGARQLIAHLRRHGFGAQTVEVPVGLHLKSAVAWLGGGRALATPAFAPLVKAALRDGLGPNGFDLVLTAPGEALAANSLAVNGHVLVPAGYPATLETLQRAGLDTIGVEVGEFEKLDGGLSCLSLRY